MKKMYDKIQLEQSKTFMEKNSVPFRHSHPNLDILFIISGKASFNIDKNSYSIKKGDLYLIKPHEFHSMIFTQDCNYEKILLTINPTILPEAVQEVITKLPVLIQNSSDLDTSNILKKLKKYTSFPDKQASVLLMYLVCELIICASNEKIGVLENEMDERVKKIVTFINDNIHKKINLEELAQYIYTSKSYMNKLFSCCLGVSIKKYIRIKKMSYAKNMLQKGKKSTDVSVALGFDEYTTFYRMYLKTYGIPPHTQKPKSK